MGEGWETWCTVPIAMCIFAGRSLSAPQTSPESNSPGTSFCRAGLPDFSPEQGSYDSRCGHSSTWRSQEGLRPAAGKWPGEAHVTCSFSSVQQRLLGETSKVMRKRLKVQRSLGQSSHWIFSGCEAARPPTRRRWAVYWTWSGQGGQWKDRLSTSLGVAGPCARVVSASSAWFGVGVPALSLAQR